MQFRETKPYIAETASFYAGNSEEARLPGQTFVSCVFCEGAYSKHPKRQFNQYLCTRLSGSIQSFPTRQARSGIRSGGIPSLAVGCRRTQQDTLGVLAGRQTYGRSDGKNAL